MTTKPLRIIITGPESVGKSTLCKHLAKTYNGIAVPEYAREYIEQLKRPYCYADVVNIAKEQTKQLKNLYHNDYQAMFHDTGPEISIVWFEQVYGYVPQFIKQFTKNMTVDLYILCDTDLPWQNDNIRENNGISREFLLKRYEQILRQHRFNYVKIQGIQKKRLKSAENILDSAYDLQKI